MANVTTKIVPAEKGPPGRAVTLESALHAGIIQEANRQFFHPLGLALAVVQPSWPLPAYLEIQQTDDQEGWAYDSLDDEVSVRRAQTVATIHAHIRDKRLAALGFDQQPIGSVISVLTEET